MTRAHARPEGHFVDRIGWLRAAVLGANDGILSTASLIVGVAAAASTTAQILVSGVAGLVAGAMSMAAGEFVSVSSQADAETADWRREADELVLDPAGEHEELAQIYVQRGLSPALARQVATELSAHDALEAHLRDELGITEMGAARPVQAAMASAASFAAGGIVPVLAVLMLTHDSVAVAVPALSLALLASLGFVGARAGGAPPMPAILRVTFWGAAAMAATFAIGRAVGTSL